MVSRKGLEDSVLEGRQRTKNTPAHVLTMPDKKAAENAQKQIDQLTEQINHLRNKGSVENKRDVLPHAIDSLEKWKQLLKVFSD